MSCRILVVDDEPALADTLALIFRRAGYNASAVYSCEEALPFVQEHHPLFIVSDVIMPGMNGVALAKIIHQTYPESGILLFSGNADTSGLLDEARTEGFEFEVMAKPVPPLKMLSRVASLVESRQLVSTNVPA